MIGLLNVVLIAVVALGIVFMVKQMSQGVTIWSIVITVILLFILVSLLPGMNDMILSL